ncbi:UNVERIFIED_CONTAM: hypothetical protein Sindi_1700900 [Sesamum indicum]
MNIDRSWMWRRLDDNGFLLDEFVTRVDQEFLNFAFHNPRFLNNEQIKCPCSKCGNTRFLNQSDTHLHIVKNGFTRGYNIWYAHGESVNTRDDVGGSSTAPRVETSRYRTMVMDAIGHEFSSNFTCAEQLPNPEAQKFFNLLKDADEPLWDGCKNHTKLSAVAQLLSIKSEYNLPEACYDRLVSTIKSMLPEDEKLLDNFYTTKKHLGKLGLGYEKIDSCVNNCILYYKENNGLQECPICYHPRYKPIKAGSRKKVAFKVLRYLPLIPRMKRLYASNYTCEHMTWHANNPSSQESMAHPSHGEAWKHFDRTHPSFASDARNVRLGLCIDGFSPFGNSRRLYGFGCSSSSTSSNSVSSTVKASDQKINELTKAVEDFSRREEENRKFFENALEEARKREEEARKREADLQELVRKLIQDVGYTNHQFPGGSGQQEQQHSRKDN